MSNTPEARPPAILVPPSKRGRKSRKASATPSVNPPAEMALLERELLRLRLHDAEYRQHAAEATVRLHEKQVMLRRLDPDNRLGLLDQAVGRSNEAAAKSKAAHAAVVKDIEARLGISLADYSYDADTGRLWRQETGGIAQE